MRSSTVSLAGFGILYWAMTLSCASRLMEIIAHIGFVSMPPSKDLPPFGVLGVQRLQCSSHKNTREQVPFVRIEWVCRLQHTAGRFL